MIRIETRKKAANDAFRQLEEAHSMLTGGTLGRQQKALFLNAFIEGASWATELIKKEIVPTIEKKDIEKKRE